MRHETRLVTVRTRWLTNGVMTPRRGAKCRLGFLAA
jgi:hypothetical protein